MDNIVYTILYVFAIPSTVILVLQTVMLLFGLGGGADGDVDVGCDGDIDCDGGFDCDDVPDDFETDAAGNLGDGGLKLFTVRGIVAFFAVGGWAGIASMQMGAPFWLGIIIFLVVGFLALLLVAYFIKWALRLQSNGTMNYKNAVGLVGEVYMTIPANNTGKGKINLVLQERYAEIEAVTASDRELVYGEKVRVVNVADDNTLIVEPIDNNIQ